MAYAFDTLGYAKRLRGAGIPAEQAEVHAEAAREFIMAELVTRSDLEAARRELDTSILGVRRDLEGAITGVRRDLEGAITGVRHDLEGAVTGLRRDLERQTLQMTVRLGGIVAIAVAVLAAIVKL